MKNIVKDLALITAFVLLPLAASASGQDARLQFEKLNILEPRARDVVEVNVDGKVLDLAKRVTAKVDDLEARRVAEAINGLKGIYVRVYRFQNENEYNPADIDEIRAQLNAPGWQRVANVRSKKNNQKVDVYTMFTGDMMSGVAVLVTESKSVALINIVGPIDLEMLTEISGKMSIPKIELERDTANEKPKEED
jgi:hypothetical protein